METIADRLLRLRNRSGLSQRALAFRGCSAVYICRIEAGHRTPSVTVIRGLAARLGVSSQYLETGVEPTVETDRVMVAQMLSLVGDDVVDEVEMGPVWAALDRLAETREVRCVSDGVNPGVWYLPAGAAVTIEQTGPDPEDISSVELVGLYEGDLSEPELGARSSEVSKIQHALSVDDVDLTACGLTVAAWSPLGEADCPACLSVPHRQVSRD